MKKKQSFILRRKEDSEMSAMHYYHGKRGATTLIACALKCTDKLMPSITVHDTSKNANIFINFDYLDKHISIVSCSFFYKGSYVISLISLEEGELYELTVHSVNPVTKIFSHTLQGSYSKVEVCLSDPTLFSVLGKKDVQFFKMAVGADKQSVSKKIQHLDEQSDLLNSSLKMEPDDCFIDQCWLKGDQRLIIASRYCAFVINDFLLEETVKYEIPEDEMKKLCREESEQEESKAKKGLYQSILFIIEQTRISGTNLVAKSAMPEILRLNYESEVHQIEWLRQTEGSANKGGQLDFETQRKVFKVLSS